MKVTIEYKNKEIKEIEEVIDFLPDKTYAKINMKDEFIYINNDEIKQIIIIGGIKNETKNNIN